MFCPLSFILNVTLETGIIEILSLGLLAIAGANSLNCSQKYNYEQPRANLVLRSAL